MTIHDAKRIARGLGYSLRRFDGEYRVAPYAGTTAEREARAYYTPDLDDALHTALAMSEHNCA